ncbi:hypothetical protein E3G68_005118 [Mycobacteroides abscessus]|uniref:DUF6283 family protein n=1 Tax=Mycobacteroides abscessus TaxID=36809 RepID=UPI001C65D65E|nr:hypothetical protein [Mycobacteroides abscessus]
MRLTHNTLVRAPAPQPCASCPYRRDVPSGMWAAEEYAKLPGYDAETPLQPPHLFLCNLTGAEDPKARVCAGWVGCHGSDLLALRLAVARGIVDGTELDVNRSTAAVPLFSSGAAAAAHGLRDIDSPGVRAREAMTKIADRRGDATTLR